MKDKPPKIDCTKCTHYYVTWDKQFPMGCKAMGFKSRQPPSLVVYMASDMECKKFEQKRKAKGRRTTG